MRDFGLMMTGVAIGGLCVRTSRIPTWEEIALAAFFGLVFWLAGSLKGVK